MKILYSPIVDYVKTKETKGISHCGDYVVDNLLHGFRSLLGSDCVDWMKNPLMYKNENHSDKFVHHGFSMFGLLDDIEVDRDDIKSKLDNNYFDMVISPIHHTMRNNQEAIDMHLTMVSQYIPNNKLVVICSDDSPGSNLFLLGDQRCTFYKVNLSNEVFSQNAGNVLPFGFSIPLEKMVTEIPEKTVDFAPMMPSYLNRGHPHETTYIYTDEAAYYKQYEESYFGVTCSKAGWDAPRHHEIIGRGCVPFFTDIESCPIMTMHNYPKVLVMGAKQMKGLNPNLTSGNLAINPDIGTAMTGMHTTGHTIDHNVFDKDLYYYIANELLSHARRHSTTEARAKEIINNGLVS